MQYDIFIALPFLESNQQFPSLETAEAYYRPVKFLSEDVTF